MGALQNESEHCLFNYNLEICYEVKGVSSLTSSSRMFIVSFIKFKTPTKTDFYCFSANWILIQQRTIPRKKGSQSKSYSLESDDHC